MYTNINELLKICNSENIPLWKVILENEIKLTGKTEEEIFEELDCRYEIMLSGAKKALEKPLTTAGDLIKGIASTQYKYSNSDNTVCGNFINKIMALALSLSEVNASMGKICAAPTAGSCGILPAVLIGISEQYNLTREETLKGLLTASGIGAIVVRNATVSGAEGGCQAECGVAAAMAACAVVEMRGGTPEMAADAFSLALSNCMGLVCDPIAGLVQVPCAQRNASQSINAVISADMVLGGMKFLIPPDEVLEAMYKVGTHLPTELRETAEGGIAATPTGKKIENIIFAK